VLLCTLTFSWPEWRKTASWDSKQLSGWAWSFPFLTGEGALSVRNRVPLCKQLHRSTMDYSCPIWCWAVCSHVRKLQVLQSKSLCITINLPWYVSNRQIHEDLGMPFFADYTDRFDSTLDDAGKPLFRQLGRYLCHPRADWSR
jgi:hypothetical protein